ncbi:MAG TPA: SPOR domain-containing protein [Rhodanobacteraceae bacterium]|nr:SPOR domain-containing protein [Rhodanobacteraceae bacterium]
MANQRNGRQAVRNGGSGIPGWGLFLGGLVVGIILCVIVVYSGHIPSLRRNDQPQANPNAVAQQGSSPGIAGSSAASSASKFDFYKVLPEKEVVIPNAELSAMAKAEQQNAAAANNAGTSAPPANATATTSSQGDYVLQVGSYSDAGKADAKKAQLALQGFTAHVQAVTLDGQVWNRVQIGPFTSATELQAVQKRLTAAGIDSIPLKER